MSFNVWKIQIQFKVLNTKKVKYFKKYLELIVT